MEKNTNIFNLKIAHVLGVGFLLFAVALLLLPAKANAQSTGISISPVKFEISSNPGEEHTSIVKIFNRGDSAQTIRLVIEDFAPVGETGNVRLLDDAPSTYALSQWVTVNPIEFIVEPNQTQSVEFKINVPMDAEPGGHYASVVATAGGSGGSGASIAQKVGSLLLLHVAGDVEEEMFVKSMQSVVEDPNNQNEYLPAGYFEYGPVTVMTRFENMGTVHLKPRGFVALTNMMGQEVDRVEIEQLNVLPNSIRRIPVELGEKWMFGKYTATMTAIYGSTNEPLSYSTTFWVFPWKVGGLVGLGVLLVLLFLFKARKRIKVAFRVLFRGH